MGATDPPRQLNCNIADADGAPLAAGTRIYTDLQVDDPALDLGVRYGGRVEEPGRFIIRFPPCAPRGQGAHLTVAIAGAEWAGRIVTPTAPSVEMGAEGGDSSIALVRTDTGPKPIIRAGVVRAAGRVLVDDLGSFHPLGATLFWAPRGWKFEPDRVRQNLAYLARFRFDYIRILCAVDWSGNEIDPAWPDYESILGGLIDCAFDDYGLRTEPTLYGGGPFNVTAIANTLVRVTKGREQKILHFEIANEAYQNGPDVATMQQAARILSDGTPNLVAMSAPQDCAPDTAAKELAGVPRPIMTIHFDRTWADGGWRTTRQGWDFNPTDLPGSSNEPAGPGSSVAEEWNPLHLAMMRATGVMVGGACYVLHNAAGIYGVSDPSRGRTANLWEMIGPQGQTIDSINAAVRGIDALLPADVENWLPSNQGWTPPNPQIPIECIDWTEHAGPVKHYGAISGARFVSMPHGIKDHFTLRALAACSWKAYDPISLAVVAERTMSAGDVVTLPGAPVVGNEEQDRNCAYVFVGERL